MDKFEFLNEKHDLCHLDIEGKRIRLVSISNQFTQDIFNEFDDVITTYMFPKPAESINETQAFIKASIESLENENNLQLVVLDKNTQEFLGCCGLHGSENIYSPELGIWLKKSVHGQGLGKETIHTLVHWTQDNIRVNSFIYPVDKHNKASCKIPESLGGKIINTQAETGMAGNLLDLVVYEIPLPLNL